jgi:hypothetical protein
MRGLQDTPDMQGTNAFLDASDVLKMVPNT